VNKPERFLLLPTLFVAAAWLVASALVASEAVVGATLRVPQDYPTIQAAINAARDGDLVLVSPGVYHENLTLSGKTITLASLFHTTSDETYIGQTILDGRGQTVVGVGASVGPETRIVGFTIQNGEDGIAASGKLHVLNNHITGNVDGVDFSSSGGFVRDNVFENNRDDGVDVDGATGVVVENNLIRDNDDDGVEVRLHEYSGPTLHIVIRGNTISGNGEDGLQLIDYPDLSPRVFRIERNLITNGDFRQPLITGWVTETRNTPNDIPGAITIVDLPGGRQAINFYRPGANWGEVAITQEVNKDVRDFKSLRLQMDVRIVFQDLFNCGQQGSECPVMVKIKYIDAEGSTLEWVKGYFYRFTDNPGIVAPLVCVSCPPPTSHHERIAPNQWQTVDSGNLLEIFQAAGAPAVTIKSITLNGSGHSFDSEVTEVQLLASE